MNKKIIILIIPLFLLVASIQAINYNLPWHENDEVSSAGYVLDVDYDGQPICGDYAIYRLADAPIAPKNVTDMETYHPIKQVEGITDDNGNGWPDYCEARGPTTGTPFTNNVVFHTLTQLTTGTGPGDFSVDSDNNGCFDYCDCLPGEYTGPGCYDDDVYNIVCGSRGVKLEECGIDYCGSNYLTCLGTDSVEVRDCYDMGCSDGICIETITVEEIQRISCLETVCGSVSQNWRCSSDWSARVKGMYCTYGTCSDGTCVPGPSVFVETQRENCPNSCVGVKCIGCDDICV